MVNKPTTISNAIFFAVLLGIVTSGAAAPPEGRGGGKEPGGDPVISVDWLTATIRPNVSVIIQHYRPHS